jgi:hypothetical protein
MPRPVEGPGSVAVVGPLVEEGFVAGAAQEAGVVAVAGARGEAGVMAVAGALLEGGLGAVPAALVEAGLVAVVALVVVVCSTSQWQTNCREGFHHRIHTQCPPV